MHSQVRTRVSSKYLEKKVDIADTYFKITLCTITTTTNNLETVKLNDFMGISSKKDSKEIPRTLFIAQQK